MERRLPPHSNIKCNAHNRKGELCGNWAMIGMTKCKFHGGASRKGLDSPRWKHGRYSKWLPLDIRDKYLAALSDPNLLQLRDDVALMDAHLAEMFQKLDHGESAAAWLNAAKAFEKLKSADHADTRMNAMQELEDAIEREVGEIEAWQEIHATVEQRRKLVAEEYKVQVNLRQMMSHEKAMALLALVADSVKEAVTQNCDNKHQAQKILDAVSHDLILITTIKAAEPRFALQEAMIGK